MENFQILPVDKLFESPLNPRRSFNEKKMAELIESIKAKGILTPLIVRRAKKIFTVTQSKINDLWYVVNEHDVRVSPGAETQEEAEKEAEALNIKDGNDGRFEIGAGHRRYRAAREAKLTEIPAVIREMSDSDFLELLTIENLQREDLQPLEEAQGYRALMEKSKYEVPAIAAKVGKSESYVYQRLKLLELIPEAQKQIAEEKITAGHAILIARLQPEQQKETLKACFYQQWGGKRDEPLSVRELSRWIDQNIHLDLNKTGFPKKDPTLIPEAGPCTTCLKRTGFAPALFPDIQKKDIRIDDPEAEGFLLFFSFLPGLLFGLPSFRLRIIVDRAPVMMFLAFGIHTDLLDLTPLVTVDHNAFLDGTAAILFVLDLMIEIPGDRFFGIVGKFFHATVPGLRET